MSRNAPRKDWPSAISGAFWLALVLALASGGACGIYGPAGVRLLWCLIVGSLVGLGTAGFMLWLFHREQVTAKEIWRAIADAWNAFGKH